VKQNVTWCLKKFKKKNERHLNGMLEFLIHIRIAWNDYFTGTPTIIQSKEYTSTQTLSSTRTHVSNCLFRSITSSSHGGALSCTSVTYLLVDSTSFISCKTSSDKGGGIYFYNSAGQCVLDKVCGYDCFSTYTGTSYDHFAHIYVMNGPSSKNYMNYSSIVQCVKMDSNSMYAVRSLYGKICYLSVNISMNKLNSRTGIICVPYKDSNSVTCSISYSTFADNIAIRYTCIFLWGSGSNYEIKSCNILRNMQGSPYSEGTILAAGNLMIKDSCILENNATYIFYAYSSSYTITLSNCTVDSTSNNRNLIIMNTVTKGFILELNHISTRNCYAEYDMAVTQSPIIKTSSNPKKKIQRSAVSLASILFFNFIHSYGYTDSL
jgi:hypothetical protein